MLALGLGGAAAVIADGLIGLGLVSRMVLPGRARPTKATAPARSRLSLEYSPPGPSFSGAFLSRGRCCGIGCTIACPSGDRPGGDAFTC